MTSAAATMPGKTGVKDTPPFSAYEWMLASRYLRARRAEGFISVIAGFSFTGIMLGVATLIIVMAVMNGFRNELFSKILGLNGHIVVNKIGGSFEDYEDIGKRIVMVPGVKAAMPLIEGQVMVTSAVQATGALVRGMSEDSLRALPLVANNIRFGTLDGFGKGTGIAIGTRLANLLRVNVGEPHARLAGGDPLRHRPAHKPYVSRLFGWACRNTTDHGLHAAAEARAISRAASRRLEIVIASPSRSTYAQAMKPPGNNHISDWRQRKRRSSPCSPWSAT
jgi:lipoprotein-releasing system permease protein